MLSQSTGHVLYALLTRPPWLRQCKHYPHHRLACVKHSVSVHPEPGSNSSFNSILFTLFFHLFFCFFLFSFHCPRQPVSPIDKNHSIKIHSLCQYLFRLFFNIFFELLSNAHFYWVFKFDFFKVCFAIH